MATSFFVTVAASPPRFPMEKSKCSLDWKWLVFDRQVFHSSLEAQPPTSRSDVPITSSCQCLPRICRSSPRGSKLAHPTCARGDGQLAVRARLPHTTSRESIRMDALKIHSRPEGLRRPVLIMAFGGWNDAAESATTAVRYLGPSFRAEKFG